MAAPSTNWTAGTISSTNWAEQDLISIPGNILLENSSNVLQEDGTSKINQE